MMKCCFHIKMYVRYRVAIQSLDLRSSLYSELSGLQVYTEFDSVIVGISYVTFSYHGINQFLEG